MNGGGRRQTVHVMNGFKRRAIKNIKMWTELDEGTYGRKSVRRGFFLIWFVQAVFWNISKNLHGKQFFWTDVNFKNVFNLISLQIYVFKFLSFKNGVSWTSRPRNSSIVTLQGYRRPWFTRMVLHRPLTSCSKFNVLRSKTPIKGQTRLYYRVEVISKHRN